MEKELVNEVIDCTSKERTVFRYFKGRYALMLLENVIGHGKAVSNIRSSSFARLLEKPEVKAALAMAGKGFVTPGLLENIWSGDTYNFILTLGSWGSNHHHDDQTSRRGYNLVLQLNFSMQHDGIYNKLVKPEYESLLNLCGHPTLETDDREYFRETLAWSRIDLDFDRNEALIEEIQNDWLRESRYLLRDALRCKKRRKILFDWWDSRGRHDDIIKYCNDILKPYWKLWDEAMLSASIEFIRNELGISNIYYHSESTGHKVKGIRYTKPPRSIYSKLPKRFCFSKTSKAPDFLNQDNFFRRKYKKIDNPMWYRMSL